MYPSSTCSTRSSKPGTSRKPTKATAAATLNQALLARNKAAQASAAWVVAAAAFVGFLLVPAFDDRVLQVEVGYVSGALALCGLLYALYRAE